MNSRQAYITEADKKKRYSSICYLFCLSVFVCLCMGHVAWFEQNDDDGIVTRYFFTPLLDKSGGRWTSVTVSYMQSLPQTVNEPRILL